MTKKKFKAGRSFFFTWNDVPVVLRPGDVDLLPSLVPARDGSLRDVPAQRRRPLQAGRRRRHGAVHVAVDAALRHGEEGEGEEDGEKGRVQGYHGSVVWCWEGVTFGGCWGVAVLEVTECKACDMEKKTTQTTTHP